MARHGSVAVELFQTLHRRFDPEHNAGSVLHAAEDTSADLLVFPELFLTGYCLGRDAYRYAMSLEDPHLQGISGIASKTGRTIIVGFPEKSMEIKGQVHNSAGIFHPDGRMEVYRKMHLVDFDPFEERGYYTPGKSPVMFELNGIRFGVTICYDIFFPELAKYYALSGADAVICISASPSTTRPFFEGVIGARAIENTTYVLYVNMVGMDGRIDFWGGCTIVGPRGEVLAKGPYFEEAKVSADIKAETIVQSRRHRPTIRDTTPELYELIIDRIKGKE